MTDRNRLKNGIKEVFLQDALANSADPSKVENIIDSLADRLSIVIDDYVKAELDRLKTSLVAPGAFAGTSNTDSATGTSLVSVTPGTIQNYQP